MKEEGMRIEEMIETPESRRAKLHLSYTRIQYLCFGVAAAGLAGYADAWWMSLQTAFAFFVMGIVLGVCKMRSCRRRSRSIAFLGHPSDPKDAATKTHAGGAFINQEEW